MDSSFFKNLDEKVLSNIKRKFKFGHIFSKSMYNFTLKVFNTAFVCFKVSGGCIKQLVVTSYMSRDRTGSMILKSFSSICNTWCTKSAFMLKFLFLCCYFSFY